MNDANYIKVIEIIKSLDGKTIEESNEILNFSKGMLNRIFCNPITVDCNNELFNKELRGIPHS